MRTLVISIADSFENLQPRPVGIVIRFLCVPILIVIMVAVKTPALIKWVAYGDEVNS